MPRHSNNVRRKIRIGLTSGRTKPADYSGFPKLPAVANFLVRLRDGWARIACHTRPVLTLAQRGMQ